MTTLVEEIVEGILIENDIDPDHPIVENLYNKVEGLQDLSLDLVEDYMFGDQLDELSGDTIRSYVSKGFDDYKKHRKVSKDKNASKKTRDNATRKWNNRTRYVNKAFDDNPQHF